MSARWIASLCLLTLPALAQDPEAKGAELAPPGPGPEHQVLAKLAGTWSVEGKMWMTPGAEPTTSTSIDQSDLVCNGMWLRSRITGTFQDQPFEGVSMLGYDPAKQKYVGLWVDAMGTYPTEYEATWDAATHTLTSTWEMPGPDGKRVKQRSVAKYDGDKRDEVCCTLGDDGSETKCMEMHSTRAPGATAKKMAPVRSPAAGKAHEALAQDVGTWDADFSMEMAGGPPQQSKCSEVCEMACNGLWLLSIFRGDFMGMPFEGRGVFGYDDAQKRYVNYWFDGASPTWSHSSGTLDAETHTLTMEGTTAGMDGKPCKTKEVMKRHGADERVFTMTTCNEAGETQSTMKIVYKRAGAAAKDAKAEKKGEKKPK